MRKGGVIALYFILVASCSPGNVEECRSDAAALARSMRKILSKVESRDDLPPLRGKLEKHFSSFVDLMIEASNLQVERLSSLPIEEGEELKQELERIYRIEGCRALIEEFGREAFYRLDLYDQKRKKEEKELY